VTVIAGVPPGRAGRMWLRRRLDAAQRGRQQLDRKLRILAAELGRIELLAEQRRHEWEAGCEQARYWLIRAALLGGQDALAAAAPVQPAAVRLGSVTIMGASYPADGAVLPPAQVTRPVGNAALEPARAAFEAALLAGVRCASAQAAARQLGAEVGLTRQRVRALDQRWLPALRQSLALLEISLEQAEQEDNVRLRRGADQRVRRSVP